MKDGLQPLPASDELPQALPTGGRNSPFDELLSPPEFAKMRGRLVRVFARRGCPVPEDLADETISRVLNRLPEIAAHYQGDPFRFVHAVARNVYREFSRRPRTVSIEDHPLEAASGDEASTREVVHTCLEACLSELDSGDRQLIREYYRYEENGKAERRRRLAADLGIALNLLRIKAFRIRKRLSLCAHECAKKNDVR
jgi:DNA-directed RNA polymerase specialized sigma24 family protein